MNRFLSLDEFLRASTIELEERNREMEARINIYTRLHQAKGIKAVYSGKGTVVVELEDGTKGIAKCSKDDNYDEYVGFCIAYTKAVFKTGSQVRKQIRTKKVEKKKRKKDDKGRK